MSYSTPLPTLAARTNDVHDHPRARAIRDWLHVFLAVLPVSAVMFPLLSKSLAYLATANSPDLGGWLLIGVFIGLGWLGCHLVASVSILLVLRKVHPGRRSAPFPIVTKSEASAEQP